MGRTSDADERLVASAVELLRARGYAGAGVEVLCRRAGVKKGSFYHFFRSKRDLVVAAVEFEWRRAKDEVVESAFRDDLPPFGRIGRFFEMLADVAVSAKAATGQVSACPFGSLVVERGGSDARIAAELRRVIGEITAYFRRALEEASAAGEVPMGDPAVGARALVAYMEGVLVLARAEGDPELIRCLGRRAIGLVSHEGG